MSLFPHLENREYHAFLTECPGELNQVIKPVYVPFLIVGSIFIAFIILGSLVAIYCCTCLRPKEPSQQPIRFSLRSYQTETLPMILTSTSLRAPSRQSSTATSSSSTGGSIRRFSFARAEPGCLVPSPPPPYTTGHPIHLTQPSGFLVSPQYFAYPLQQEPPLPAKSCPDFSSS
ncbi:protein shisa-3 homolog [Puma concolor]|uniref:Protein shisa-3 homolog n=1 Tax=Puma concolor TaxID=9696 RepID=A0A6P6HR65_PUMCO|nr:protein shisa-3 homolog [Puma concolor]